MKHILVIAEIFQGAVRPVTWELAEAALKIAELEAKQKYSSYDSENKENHLKDKEKEKENNFKPKKSIGKSLENKEFQGKKSHRIKIIAMGNDPMAMADEIAEHTSMDIIGLKIPGLNTYDSDACKICLCKLINKMKFSHVLIAHTSQGRDFAPGLGLKLNAAFIPGVNSIMSDEHGIIYSRPVFGNTRNMIIRPAPGFPVVLTIMPGMFTYVDKFNKLNNTAGQGLKKIYEIPFCSENGKFTRRIIHRRILRKKCQSQALKGAKIIVSAGRGIGDKDKLEEIFKFAECFSSAAVGASRPLVDMGWIGYEHQVGITGAEVAPKLYIACGISGSSQHLAGMKNSEIVVSINKNSNAPIFRHSDICVKADIHEFIHEFIKQNQQKN